MAPGKSGFYVTDLMDVSLSELREMVMDREAWRAAIHGVTELDTTERLHFHFSLSCIGEGNGNISRRNPGFPAVT